MAGMATRVPSLLDPPVAFANRGARAHVAECTLEAFRLAVKLGATGIRAEAWRTADGEVVLHPEGVVRSGLRKRPLAGLPRTALPTDVPTLPEVYDACGRALHVCLTVPHAEDVPAVVAAARGAEAAPGHLWLRSDDPERLVGWRPLGDDVRLVVATRFRHLRKSGLERQAASWRDVGIDAVELPADDWSAGITTLFHRFGRLTVGGEAQHRRQLDELMILGIDAVVGDHVDRMADALHARI